MKHENGASAEEMEVQLCRDMDTWELHNDSFMAIVTDSAANMNAFGKRIERWGTKYARHHYCVDHVLQLTALIAFSGNFTAQNDDEDNSVACLRKARDLVSHVNSSTIANEKLATAQKAIQPGRKVYKLLQDVCTRWWSTADLIERVIKLEAPLKRMFRQEFVNRIQENQPTLLEGYKLSDDDFDGLRNILHALKPIRVAQRCLEGELYVTISLLPYVIYQLDIELEQCFGAANPDADQQALSELLEKMLDDFRTRWGEGVNYEFTIQRGARNRKIGIPAYAFWAMVLDPRTKKYLSKVLPNGTERTRLWNDVQRCCYEIARERELAEVQDVTGRDGNEAGNGIEENNNGAAQKRRKVGAASFFPESSEDDEATEAGNNNVTLEDMVTAEIRRYQVAKGIKLETDGVYNCPLSWWKENHLKYPHIWKLAQRILAVPSTSAPSERVFSSAANIVNKKRVSLKPENVDLLVFLRGNKEFVKWD